VTEPRGADLTPKEVREAHRLWGQPTADSWLECLERHPMALNSLIILEEVSRAVVWLERLLPKRLRATLTEPLLQRGTEIVRATLQAAGGPVRLARTELGQRAIMLVGRRLQQAFNHERCTELLEAGEVLVQLDVAHANDLRLWLTDLHLTHGRHDVAVEIVRRLGDGDDCHVILAATLALWRLGHADEAAMRLSEPRVRSIVSKARQTSEGILPHLLDDPLEKLYRLLPPRTPPPPETGELGVLTAQWVQSPGALEWLRAILKPQSLH
jgi:hypothetical protein